MAKFIMSMGDKTLQLLSAEAEKRNVRVQELLRAVIVPEWVRDNLETSHREPTGREINPRMNRQSISNPRQQPALESTIHRSKRQLANYLWSFPVESD